MKINYVMTGIGKTGGSYVISEIVRGLLARGHDVTITTNYGQKAEGIKLVTPEHLIDRVEYPFYSSRNILFRLFGKVFSNIAPVYAGFTRRIRFLDSIIPDCDINVATDCFSAYPTCKSQKGRGFYHMQHYESIFFDNPKLKRLAEETYDLPLSKIANSIWLSNQIKEKHGFEPPIVNPAINHNKFYPRDLKGPSYRRRILCYGRRDKWKGFKDAIDAMRIVFKKIQDVEWIVYGFKYLPKSFDVPYTHVGFLNHEELAKLYSSVDAFFLPSWFESFPLQPLEAMACGTPVITTRFGTEDYAFDGVNAVVVPPKNPKALAAAIIRLLDDKDLREKLSKEGLNTAKKFTWNRTVDQVEELFKNALK